MRQGRPAHARRVRAGRVAHVADRRQRRRVGAGQAGHRRRARARPGARDHREQAAAGDAAGAPRRSIDGWSGGLRRLRAGEGRADHRRRRRSASSVWRASSPSSGRRSRVIGGAPLAHTNGLFTALAVNALNELLGAVGQPGGMFFTPQRRPALSPQRSAADAALAVREGPAARRREPGLRHAEGAGRCARRSTTVPFIVSFGSFIDDTSALADLILPGPLVPRVVGRQHAGIGIDRSR